MSKSLSCLLAFAVATLLGCDGNKTWTKNTASAQVVQEAPLGTPLTDSEALALLEKAPPSTADGYIRIVRRVRMGQPVDALNAEIAKAATDGFVTFRATPQQAISFVRLLGGSRACGVERILVDGNLSGWSQEDVIALAATTAEPLSMGGACWGRIEDARKTALWRVATNALPLQQQVAVETALTN